MNVEAHVQACKKILVIVSLTLVMVGHTDHCFFPTNSMWVLRIVAAHDKCIIPVGTAKSQQSDQQKNCRKMQHHDKTNLLLNAKNALQKCWHRQVVNFILICDCDLKESRSNIHNAIWPMAILLINRYSIGLWIEANSQSYWLARDRIPLTLSVSTCKEAPHSALKHWLRFSLWATIVHLGFLLSSVSTTGIFDLRPCQNGTMTALTFRCLAPGIYLTAPRSTVRHCRSYQHATGRRRRQRCQRRKWVCARMHAAVSTHQWFWDKHDSLSTDNLL